MIGNDIIDIKRAKIESDWRRKGFLNKLFTSYEQELIKGSNNPEIIVWSLWSMKEAVYKAEFRSSLKFEYAPLNAYCLELKDTLRGFESMYEYNQQKYFTTTQFISDFIHTIAYKSLTDFKQLRVVVKKSYPKQYFTYLKNIKFLSKQEEIIKNEYGVPNILDIESGEIYPMSISHHGNFLGVIRTPFLIN